MKKIFSCGALALMTMFSCQNETELETAPVSKQNVAVNQKTAEVDIDAATGAKVLAEDNFTDKISTSNWTVIKDAKPKDASGMCAAIKDWKNYTENVKIENGKLVLTLEKVDSKTVKSGRIQAVKGGSFDRKFGFVEIYAKIPSPDTYGVQGAFWFYNHGDKIDNSGADGAEIDVFESTHQKTRYEVTIHIDAKRNKKHRIKTFENSINNYRKYGMEWKKDIINIYYHDGKAYKLITTFWNGEDNINWIPNVNEYLIFSVAPSWGNAKDIFCKLASGSKASMYIDWVKWWDKKPF